MSTADAARDTIPTMLRDLADRFDSGEHTADSVTVLVPSGPKPKVFTYGRCEGLGEVMVLCNETSQMIPLNSAGKMMMDKLPQFMAVTIAMLVTDPVNGPERVSKKVRKTLGLSPDAPITAERVLEAMTLLNAQP